VSDISSPLAVDSDALKCLASPSKPRGILHIPPMVGFRFMFLGKKEFFDVGDRLRCGRREMELRRL
jgi:hypothetical protein